ncbi:MAG: recombination protein NinB [Candidatus Aenigmarchaeota archaeon]|nr:recombination protein NinB [Candidatus Aenigmarchaeota archaeon]
MKTLANNIRLQYDEHASPEIVITTTATQREAQEAISQLKEVVARGKPLSVEIKQHRQRRSLDANAYMWVLLSKMAAILKTTKDDLYIEMLDRYGIFTHIVVKPSVVDRVKEEWRTVRELGEITVNGKTGIQLMCYFGSSTYDTKEMSVLIDGIVSECKDLGIETLLPHELEILKNEWGKQDA